MNRFDVEVKVEKLKAKARGYLRGKLETAVKRIQKAQERLGEPRINKSKLLGPMVEMVYKDLLKAIEVIYVDSHSQIKDDVRKAVSEYVRSGEYGKPKPPAPVVVDNQSVSKIRFVTLPDYVRPPKRRGSKAAEQQVKHMRYRRYKGPIYEPCEATPEQLEALKKALRVE